MEPYLLPGADTLQAARKILPRRVISVWRRIPEATRGYIVAVVSVAVATVAGFLLRDFLSRSIFILFAAPVAMAAWYAGRGPALVAIAGGVLAAVLVFVDTHSLIVPADPRDIVAIGAFIFVGFIIMHLNGLIRSARADAQRYATQMEEQALELEVQTAELEQQMHEAQALSEELAEAHRSLEERAGEQLAEAQALARLGSWEWDIARNRITWSDEMYRLFGLEPGSVEIDFERYQSMLHSDDRAVAAEVVQRAIERNEDFTFDHRVIRPDGAERIFHARGRVIAGVDGIPVRMLGTGQDVTESRRAEAALRSATEFAARQATAEAAARHLNRVFSQAPVVIAVLRGPEHEFELVNDNAVEVIGSGDILGKTVRGALPNPAAQGFVDLLDSVYKTGEPFIGREVNARFTEEPEAAHRYFNFVFQPLMDDGKPYGVLVVATEVSDLVEARLAAEKAQREAVAASMAKSDFLARMSHELRTPLAAIIGYGELLSDGITGPVNEEQKRQLTRIRWSANHLLSIIDEILTLARMEAGKERVELQDVDVPQLMESVASMAEPLAAAKGLAFHLDVPGDDMTMRTDPMKVRQVLLNLISNAVKYTDHGAVRLSTEAVDGQVHFVVDDTGIGVSPEHLDRIFEPFWQVEQTTTRRAGGTGLGLAVTRQFVDLLGGSITVNSEMGGGSSFRVTLPRS